MTSDYQTTPLPFSTRAEMHKRFAAAMEHIDALGDLADQLCLFELRAIATHMYDALDGYRSERVESFEQAERRLTASASPAPGAIPAALKMVARAEKVRTLAATFFLRGVTAAHVSQISRDQWHVLHVALKRVGVLRPQSTIPSSETIAQTVKALIILESRRVS